MNVFDGVLEGLQTVREFSRALQPLAMSIAVCRCGRTGPVRLRLLRLSVQSLQLVVDETCESANTRGQRIELVEVDREPPCVGVPYDPISFQDISSKLKPAPDDWSVVCKVSAVTPSLDANSTKASQTSTAP